MKHSQPPTAGYAIYNNLLKSADISSVLQIILTCVALVSYATVVKGHSTADGTSVDLISSATVVKRDSAAKCNLPDKDYRRAIDERELSKILLDHEKWLVDKSTGKRANLAGAYLVKQNLRDAKLRGACLKGARLDHADLAESDLRGADMQGASLQYANLYAAHLYTSNSGVSNGDKNNCECSEYADREHPGGNGIDENKPTDLRGADLQYSNLIKANFTGASMNKALLWGAAMDKETVFKRACLEDAEFVVQEDKDWHELRIVEKDKNIPDKGRSLVVIQKKKNSLHIRYFDEEGKLTDLPIQNKQIELLSARDIKRLSPDKRLKILDEARELAVKLNLPPNDNIVFPIKSLIFEKAKMKNAQLAGLNLKDSNFKEACLRGANFDGSKLEKANFSSADLTEATLDGAAVMEKNSEKHCKVLKKHEKKSGVKFNEAKLIKTQFRSAFLPGSEFKKANLTEAVFEGACLAYAKFDDTIVNKTTFSNAELWHADFSVRPKQGSASGARGLETVMIEDGQQSGLVELRDSLKASGLRNLERDATYSIEKAKTENAWILKKYVRYVLFDLTSKYGRTPLRCLVIMLFLIPFFAVLYAFAIFTSNEESSQQYGIYKVWHEGRVQQDLPKKSNGKPEENPGLISGSIWKSLGYGLYFSLLSAIELGWRDINVGTWIARIQSNEYNLRSTGWVRTVSGIQSLISIYLMALWVLTEFGRPFG